jgi:replicative DNA helicase
MAKVYTSAALMLRNENVLFVSLEMPEKEISKRVDANILGCTINELSTLPESELLSKWSKIKDKIGKLVIKEYGAGTFNTMMLRSLLDELKTKKDFIPDAIVIDYLGLMTSHRADKTANSYDSLGKVAEDLHAVAKETYDSKGNKGIKLITSAQMNRSSYNNVSDSGMESVSESMKIMMTADVAIMLNSTEQMREEKQQVWKIIKNRYTGQMTSHIMETHFDRVQYRDFGNEDSENSSSISSVDVVSTGASSTTSSMDDMDFGSLNFN